MLRYYFKKRPTFFGGPVKCCLLKSFTEFSLSKKHSAKISP